MRFRYLKFISIYALLSIRAFGDDINYLSTFRTTNNFNDLNPSRDAMSCPVGDIHITHTMTDGVSPVDFTFLTSDIYLQFIHLVSGWTNYAKAAFYTNDAGTVRWEFRNIQNGEYRLFCEITTAVDTYPVFDRYLTVTSRIASATSTDERTRYGYNGGTNEPHFVKIFIGGILATGLVEGANLYLHFPGSETNSITNGGFSVQGYRVSNTSNIWVHFAVSNVAFATTSGYDVATGLLTLDIDDATGGGGAGWTSYTNWVLTTGDAQTIFIDIPTNKIIYLEMFMQGTGVTVSADLALAINNDHTSPNAYNNNAHGMVYATHIATAVASTQYMYAANLMNYNNSVMTRSQDQIYIYPAGVAGYSRTTIRSTKYGQYGMVMAGSGGWIESVCIYTNLATPTSLVFRTTDVGNIRTSSYANVFTRDF